MKKKQTQTVVASTPGEYLVMTGMSSSDAASEVGHVQPEFESAEGGLRHETTVEKLRTVDRIGGACRYGTAGFWCNGPIGKVRCLRRHLANDRSAGRYHQQPVRIKGIRKITSGLRAALFYLTGKE